MERQPKQSLLWQQVAVEHSLPLSTHPVKWSSIQSERSVSARHFPLKDLYHNLGIEVSNLPDHLYHQRNEHAFHHLISVQQRGHPTIPHLLQLPPPIPDKICIRGLSTDTQSKRLNLWKVTRC
jgi:hypothetical protein